MKTLKSRVEALERDVPTTSIKGCVAFARSDEDPEQKAKEALADFKTKHGHAPTVMSTVQFVKPPARRDDE